MASLKWSGLNNGYVSNDGRFLVAQVWVDGKHGKVPKWAVYGLVIERTPTGDCRIPPWSWGDQWLKGPFERKKDAQAWCEKATYETPVRTKGPTTEPLGSLGSLGAQDRPGPGRCPECTVRFEPESGHKYEEWCGRNCAEDALERLTRILDKGVKLHGMDGRALRIGPTRGNEPDFRPNRGER